MNKEKLMVKENLIKLITLHNAFDIPEHLQFLPEFDLIKDVPAPDKFCPIVGFVDGKFFNEVGFFINLEALPIDNIKAVKEHLVNNWVNHKDKNLQNAKGKPEEVEFEPKEELVIVGVDKEDVIRMIRGTYPNKRHSSLVECPFFQKVHRYINSIDLFEWSDGELRELEISELWDFYRKLKNSWK